MYDTSTLVAAIILAFLGGVAGVKIVEFFVIPEAKDEKDDQIEKTQRIVTDLQKLHESIKLRLRDIQSRYYECQYMTTEIQIKLDETLQERAKLEKQVRELESKLEEKNA